MFKICAHQFRQAFFSPRLYLALILGCTIQIISVFPLLDFSKAMGEPLGIFEAFIYFNTDTYTATCAFLGAVLMVSDIPFSSQNETYTLLRVSRKTWVAGKVLYLLGISAVYYLVLFIAGALFISENAFVANIWSLPLTVLVQNQAPELAWEYQVSFPYGHLLTLTPAIACVLSYLLSVCYVFVMSLIIFWLNLRISKVLSYLAAVLVHVAEESLRELTELIAPVGMLTPYASCSEENGVLIVRMENRQFCVPAEDGTDAFLAAMQARALPLPAVLAALTVWCTGYGCTLCWEAAR